MKTSSPTDTSEPRQALIFIPDISGFTQFVTDTEINHSRHIIEELLETLIDANKIGLEISEIEGDAILFYRFGQAPAAEEMLDQVKQMFSKFHLHLKKYESHRVCNCGACRTANNLAIKFIAHYGEITMNSVRQYKKLFGKEVIVAHRLLKNDINQHEYSLFTDNLTQTSDSWTNIESTTWSSVEHAEKEYDSGKVQFTYLSLDTLRNQLPEIVMEDYGIGGKKSKVMDTQGIIHAPLELVFNVVADVSWRSKWIPGTTEIVTDINSHLTQSGQTHKCLANGPIIIGYDFHRNDNTISFMETDTKKTYDVAYTLKQLSGDQTQVSGSLFLPKNPVKELMFKLLMKKKMLQAFGGAWQNLNQYCSGLVERGEQHSYSVLIPDEQTAVMA